MQVARRVPCVESDSKAPLGHTENFDLSDATLFVRAVNALQPGAGGRSIVALLDGKINRTTVLSWKSGRRHAPRWALDLLASKIQARVDELQAIAHAARTAPERPGKQAGAQNLAAYLAKRNA